MMGYTHAAIGAGSALAYSMVVGDGSPELYVVSTITGALGGVAIDVDVHDHKTNPKVTDGSRSRIAIAILLGVGAILDFVFKFGIMSVVIDRQYVAIGGVIAFVALMIIGYNTDHRSFTHSILFTVLTGACIFAVFPYATEYYVIGCISHLLLDLLNGKYHEHGVWLFYPIKIGKGIALGWCKAGRKGNKVFYFIGIIAFIAMSALYIWQINDLHNSIAPGIVFIYFVIAMHFVRRKSEREQRHIMHMKGEI